MTLGASQHLFYTESKEQENGRQWIDPPFLTLVSFWVWVDDACV